MALTRLLIRMYRRVHLAVLEHELDGLTRYYDEFIITDKDTPLHTSKWYQDRLLTARRRVEQARIDLFVAGLL